MAKTDDTDREWEQRSIPACESCAELRARLESAERERDEASLQRAATWGLFEGTQERLKEAVGALREMVALCTETRHAQYGQLEPDVIDALHFTAEKVRAHSGYDPGKPLDELADRIRVATDAARAALGAAGEEQAGG